MPTQRTIGISERLIDELARLSEVQHRAARETAAVRAALTQSRLGRSTAVIAAVLSERGVDARRVLGDVA